MTRLLGSYRRNVPLTVALNETLPATSAIATNASNRSSSQRGRGRMGPRTRGSAGADGRGAACPGAAGVVMRVASPAGPFEPHADLADLDLVPEPDRRDAFDATPVDVRPVGAAEVLEVPASTAIRQDRVLGRGERVVDDDGVVDVAPERRDHVETERLAGGRLAAGRREHDEPAGPLGRLAGGGAQVAQQRRDDPREEQVDEPEEQQPDGPHHQEEWVHQFGAPATSTTSAVSPISRRSPAPSTTSVTGTPFTRDPLVLPRST